MATKRRTLATDRQAVTATERAAERDEAPASGPAEAGPAPDSLEDLAARVRRLEEILR